MLVVSRKIQESIVVGEFDGCDSVLKVTVIAVHEGKVKLGFEVVSDLPATPLQQWKRHDALEAASYSRAGQYARPSEPRELSFDAGPAHLTSGEIIDDYVGNVDVT